MLYLSRCAPVLIVESGEGLGADGAECELGRLSWASEWERGGWSVEVEEKEEEEVSDGNAAERSGKTATEGRDWWSIILYYLNEINSISI